MLVIISDLHLGDNTCARTLSPGAFHIFRDRLEELVEIASVRADGSYEPIRQIDLLLLGDVFELLHTTRWFELSAPQREPLRPWDDPCQPDFTAKIQEITTGILEANAEGLGLLHKMARGEAISLPERDRRGRPRRSASERVPVKVSIHFMVGNHDWMYHLPGAEMDQVRLQIVQAMGLHNPPGPFPHEIGEIPFLGELCQSHGVFARHGDIYDSFNYDQDKGRNASALGDVLSVELISRFPYLVEQRLQGFFSPSFFRELYEITNVRPSIAAPLWVSGKLQQSGGSLTHLRMIKEIWNEVVAEFLDLDFVRQQDMPGIPDIVDLLGAGLRLTRRVSFNRINQLVAWLGKRRWREDFSLQEYALREEVFLNRQADFIVYGHTHHHETVPLDTYYQGAEPVNQWLVNSGTWRVFYDLARRVPAAQAFMPYQVMTYLAFYRQNERRGHPYEAWSGTLV
ncbi:MAG: hypothetical protein JXB15_13680 [Anaerolineales bacterium]|nr:hypothetical protein [Anaerolineales bacterium]